MTKTLMNQGHIDFFFSNASLVLLVPTNKIKEQWPVPCYASFGAFRRSALSRAAAASTATLATLGLPSEDFGQ